MGLPIPVIPSPGTPTALLIGTPVSGSQNATIAESLAFLTGRNLPPIVSCTDLRPCDPCDVYVLYQRTAGCSVIRVCAELNAGTSTDTRCTVTVSLDTGTGSVTALPSLESTTTQGALDGSRPLPATAGVQGDYPVWEGYFDVTGLTVGDVSVLKIAAVEVAASGGNGLFAVHVHEVPIAGSNPVADPATEIGVDPAWTYADNGLMDGAADSPRGFGRVVRELERSRHEVPRHLQLVTPEGAPWNRSVSGFGSFNWGTGLGAAYTMTWRMRVRRLYAPGSTSLHKFLARFAWNGTPGTAAIRCTADTTGLGGSTTTPADIVLTATGSTSTYVIASVEIDLPTDGTDQQCEITFTAEADGSTLNVTNLALIEYEQPADPFIDALFDWSAELSAVTKPSSEITVFLDQTGNGRDATKVSSNGAEWWLDGVNGKAYALGNAHTAESYYSCPHETALEPDSWTVLLVAGLANTNLDWILVKAAGVGSTGADLTDGWGVKDTYSGTSSPNLGAFDSTWDTDGTPGTRQIDDEFNSGAQPFNSPGAYVIRYDAVAETLTITDARGNTATKTGVTAPRTTGTANLLFMGSNGWAGSGVSSDARVYRCAMWGVAKSDGWTTATLAKMHSDYSLNLY